MQCKQDNIQNKWTRLTGELQSDHNGVRQNINLEVCNLIIFIDYLNFKVLERTDDSDSGYDSQNCVYLLDIYFKGTIFLRFDLKIIPSLLGTSAKNMICSKTKTA